MATGSMREAVKALTTTFSAPTVPYPLPVDIQQTIEAFLDRHQDTDEHDSQRLQDELLPLYKRYVAGNSEKHGPFISVLKLLRPAIRGAARLEEWWSLVIRPTVDAIGHKRSEIEDARDFILGILVFDPDDDEDGENARLSALFSAKLLNAYLLRTRGPSAEEGNVSAEDEFIAHELESILVAFGRRKPKELLLALDELFLRKDYRIQVLNLLSAFVRLQPPHLHLVLETPLIQHLEKCLMIDTSSTVIELALMVLIMFLPHITSSLTSDHHLSRLFLIYSRALCWDKFGEFTQEEPKAEEDNLGHEDERIHDGLEIEQSWEKLNRSFDYPENVVPGLLHFFTFLYGLFPLNFMSYIRKPRKYLKAIDFPGADDFDLDQDLIRSRTEPYRRVHLLHPNMFTTTLDDELSENRWLKSDPADVVTECMELCVAVASTLDDPGPPPTTKLPDIPGPMVPTEDIPQDGVFTLDEESATSWRNTQSTMFSPSNNWLPDNVEFPPKSNQSTYTQSVPKSSKPTTPVLKSRDVMDSPTLPAALKDDADSKNLQPKKQRSQNLRKEGSVPGPRSNIPTSPRLENFALTLSHSQSHHSDSPTRADFQAQNIASLQREIMLLRNDLNFERYLKLQHLSHIGQLQRRHIKEVTVEAETQNLINTNRTLKAKLAKANELYAQLKKETLTSRSQSKKWESELSSKVRSYREEQKSWHADEDSLRMDLQKAQQDCDRLRRLVVESEARELNATQRLRALELDLEDLENLRKQNEALQERVQDLQETSAELDATRQERDHLRDDLEMATMKLSSRDMERERSMRLYERKILELESRLQSSQRNIQPGQLPGSVQQMLDSALAASQAKLQQMKKTHYRLLEQYTELQVRYQELEGERQAETTRFDSYGQTADEHTLNQPPTGHNSGASGYGSKYPRPLVTNPQQDYDYYNEYYSPTSTNSPSTQLYPPRPVRRESLHHQRSIREPVSPTLDLSAAYESSLNASFHLQNASDTVASSGRSGYSVDTNSSKGEKKEKIVPKSEVRVYGRGGAQNIGKKAKDKNDKKDKQPKSGGFRGLKGIM